MNSMRLRVATGLVLITGLLVGGIASASAITMNFDGLTRGTSVHNYYDGGCSIGGLIPHNIDCGGPDYGVVWKGASVRDLSVHQPSNPNFIVPTDANLLVATATMNVAGGFDTGLSFYYAASSLGGVAVYTGLDGSGSLLAQADVLFPDIQCKNVPCWNFVDLSFSGIAKSVIFRGILGPIGFDNVTLGAAPTAPVPEPAALGMFGFGMLLIGCFAALRRRVLQD